ncbi:hypothetical protein GMA12_14850 [Kocuria sediminis]|uniref:Uncharacterized protein n=1 Tax=Kocuria sediminis TaxID=1038857 RepID=A0A6N8GUB9_9MICC|nr:hypothetical protein [Kocuria sediminis]MUN64404.1 hypothetical protein [Kocuria sediminis]
MTAPSPTTAPARWILGLSRVVPGDRIEVWEHRQLRSTGTVSQVAPHLGVLWLLEDRTGIPRLATLRDHRLRRCPLRPAA